MNILKKIIEYIIINIFTNNYRTDYQFIYQRIIDSFIRFESVNQLFMITVSRHPEDYISGIRLKSRILLTSFVRFACFITSLRFFTSGLINKVNKY